MYCLKLSVTLYGADLSADITSCITEAENCMSLLLSDRDIFGVDTERRDFDAVAALHVSDSRGGEDINEINNELDVNSQSQYEHKDVDCEMELTADSISEGRSADGGRSSDGSLTSTDAVCRSHDEQSDTVDELPNVNIYRQHGVHSFRYALHIDIASNIRIEQSEDNADVVRSLQELTTLLVNRYTPTVKRWLGVNIYCTWSSFLQFFGDRL